MGGPAPAPPFAGRVVLVTGASSGIGEATALAFAGAGADLALVGRDRERLAATGQACAVAGAGRMIILPTDLTESSAPSRVVEDTMAACGRIDVLVNAAGIIASGSGEETSDEMYDRVMDINVRALFRLTRAAIPPLCASGGNIVNVSSVAGLRPYPGILAYCVSKAAVDQMTRCLALEMGPRGVRVNAINPGVVITRLHRRGGMDEAEYAGFLERGAATHPLGRVGRAEEVADLILFLASPSASWITGTTLSIDGGRAQTSMR